MTQVIQAAKPLLRGWLHAGAFPVVACAGLTLIVVAPTWQARLACAVYAVTSALMFGTSGYYHRRGSPSPRLAETLRRLDHANIYLIIAGTYTPFAVIALDGAARTAVLLTIWVGAAAGVAFRTVWLAAPRWLYTSLYIVLGWTAVLFAPQFLDGLGVPALVFVIVGGLLYSAGGVVYALKRPNPSDRWFGFHEVFHAFTVAAYVSQFVAVALVAAKAA
ncbi:MAG: PAQR family membrane homeostasis protein TrhA [Stackebrandtia sp.]